ncbi:single-stranded DNA-binding protein [Pseudomonas sp. 5P_3.1_Bac2]|uniref:single-stranded DNA-binding protein n=1 Tax=Pseudomonas sp. 5P_3.1_Bac2 TaxID=2971617 RepID=UPI0021C742D3|nr:single-stranded DNA-binding protein [Pseudomonas sp. 5P_3.1_Bac2]MCU1717352.1 single-stranded DNA-binding protein [Pseudomonas sp. 5P_3.1_Bac2]
MAQMFGVARIGRDAEVRYTASGDAVVSLSLAFEYGKKTDGKKPVQWVDAALWGKRGEAMAPHLLKGQKVGVTLDDVHIETFTKADHSQGHKLVGRVSNIEFAGGPPQQQPQQARQPAPRPAAQPAARQAPDYDSFDDDIPF